MTPMRVVIAIGRLDEAEALLTGKAGTIITCDSGSG
jgi:hypothetical protein